MAYEAYKDGQPRKGTGHPKVHSATPPPKPRIHGTSAAPTKPKAAGGSKLPYGTAFAKPKQAGTVSPFGRR